MSLSPPTPTTPCRTATRLSCNGSPSSPPKWQRPPHRVRMTQIRHHAHRDGIHQRRQHPWRRPSGGECVEPPPLQTSTRDDVLRQLLRRRRGAVHHQRLGREQQKVRAVLLICADCTAVYFRAPSEEYLDGLMGQGLFGDGTAAVVVGAEPHPELEKSLFEIRWAGTAVVPDTLEPSPIPHGNRYPIVELRTL